MYLRGRRDRVLNHAEAEDCSPRAWCDRSRCSGSKRPPAGSDGLFGSTAWSGNDSQEVFP